MTRRDFVKDIAVATSAVMAGQAGSPLLPDFKKIILAPESPLPVRTAAQELSDKRGAAIAEGPLPQAIGECFRRTQ
jgi:hypothetical protein